jgi:HAD superfamily hydrolase (TIGR01549 family)
MMPRGRFRAVLFDWDGTLVNSAEGSYRCYVRLFASFGIRFDRATFERTYSPNWYRTYAEMGLPESQWSTADARWLELYASEGNELIAGAKQALVRLNDAGLVQGLVTSGSRERVAKDIVSLEVQDYFCTVVCAEDVMRKKPDPEALLFALERVSVAPADTAYVGDSPEDVAMARAAGAFSVGIPGGFPNRAALRASAPDLLADDLAAAVTALL